LAYIDEQVAFMPIKTVQNLIDTEKQEYWIARLKSFQLTDKTLPKVKEIISDGNHSLEVKGWKELAELYKQAESFFNNQEFIIQMILLVLSVLAIFNTVGMAVYERTGEIGTLRSLGQTKKEIMGHFLTEGILLGSQGAILGWALGLLVKNVINSAGLTTRLPATSLPTIIQIDFQISHYIAASIFSLVVTILGSLAPAVRASQINIVEALRKNI
jgi:putative ABC transport system permease protein